MHFPQGICALEFQMIGETMAARKSTLKPAPKRPELEALLDAARAGGISDEQMQEQRASFAYGNAPDGADRITKESARIASKQNRLISA